MVQSQGSSCNIEVHFVDRQVQNRVLHVLPRHKSVGCQSTLVLPAPNFLLFLAVGMICAIKRTASPLQIIIDDCQKTAPAYATQKILSQLLNSMEKEENTPIMGTPESLPRS